MNITLLEKSDSYVEAMTRKFSGEWRQFGMIFAWVLLIGVLTYSYFAVHQLLHNHGARIPWVPDNDQIWAGRWLNLALMHLTYRADVPLYMQVFGVFLGTVTSYIVLRTWGVFDQSKAAIMMTSLFIILFPATLAFFFYTYQTPLFFFGWLFAAWAAYLISRPFSLLNLAFASLLVMACAASYQATIGVYAVTIAGLAIMSLVRSDDMSEKDILLLVGRSVLALAAGLALYYVSLRVLSIQPPGQASFLDLGALWQQFMDSSRAAFLHLWLSQPDLMRGQKVLLLAILLSAIAISFLKVSKRPARIIFLAACWVGIILSTKLIFFLVDLAGPPYQYRYNTALGFLHAFSIFFLFWAVSGRTVQLVVLIVSVVVCVRFAQADLVRQGVLYRGEMHDLALTNRILTRIEGLEGLNAQESYDLVRIGFLPRYREALMRSQGRRWDVLGDGHMDHAETTAVWADEVVFRFLGSSVRFQRSFDANWRERGDQARAELLIDRQPWPHESSVFLVGDTIYVYMR
jgi:hypothetical protein